MTSVWFSVRFCEKNWFSVQFPFYKINCVRFFSVRLGLHSFVSHLSFTPLHPVLEITYFRAELVQLMVSRSDSELEVQRYGIKKNTLTVDPVMLEDEL